MSDRNDPVVCKVCFRRCPTRTAFYAHVREEHVSLVEYAKAVLPRKGKRRRYQPYCECGADKRLVSLKIGFQRFCSPKCPARSEKRHRMEDSRSEDFRVLKGRVRILDVHGASIKDVLVDGKKFENLMGYEHLFLRDVEELGFSLEEFVRRVPIVPWKRKDGSIGFYSASFYSPSRELLVDVKSDYTYERSKEDVLRRVRTATKFGFNVVSVVYGGDLMVPQVTEYKALPCKAETRNHLLNFQRGRLRTLNIS